MATVERRILYVGSDPTAGERVAEALTDSATAVTREDATGGLDRLASGDIDCVVSEYQLPGMDGLEFIERVRERRSACPFVLYPDDGSERVAATAFRAGATDYVPTTDGSEELADRVDRIVSDSAAGGATDETGQLDRVLDRISDAFYAVDDDWIITYWNRQMAARTDTDPDVVVGSHLWDIFPEAEGTELYERLHETMTQQESRSFETYYEPGEYWLEYHAYPARDGLSVYSRNITDRKERQRELERYETMVETVGNGVYTFDEDYYFTAVNDAMTDLTGYRESELLSAHASLIFDDADLSAAWEARQHLLESESSVMTVERDIQHKDGSSFPAEIHFGLLPYEDAFQGTAGVISDISDRKARQRELERKNERLEEFAGIVSHDLRNPLEVATGSLELYRETGDEQRLDDIESAHERMATIIDDVLTLAREGDAELDHERVPLQRVARDAWESVSTAEATLAIETDADVRADERRLSHLFENLFRNAVEHGSTSSRTGSDDAVEHSSTSNQPQPDDAVEHTSPAVTVRLGPLDDGFFVADDGPGIPVDMRETVFERGYSTETDGTGYGLAIVAEVVRSHDWTITVTESADGGARFEIRCTEMTDEE